MKKQAKQLTLSLVATAIISQAAFASSHSEAPNITRLPTLAPTNFPQVDLVTAFLTGFEGVNQLATVTPSEMLRLNTTIAAKFADEQSPFCVTGDYLADFPNGRRPGDDVVDIALRVVMGRLCHPVPVAGTDTDLGLCAPKDANVGTVPFTACFHDDCRLINCNRQLCI